MFNSERPWRGAQRQFRAQPRQMKRVLKRVRLAAVVALAAATLTGAQGLAQNTRSFVSGQGLDTNPCTRAAPCRTLQVAHNATSPKGEIAILDSAGYGPLTISKAISIVNPGGVEAGITPQGASAITVAVALSDTVSLRGLTLEGAGSQFPGIFFQAGYRLEIINCVVRDFLTGLSAGGADSLSIYIANTTFADNGQAGISVETFGGGATIIAANNVKAINNPYGIKALASDASSPIEIFVSDSHIDNNMTAGLLVIGANAVMRKTTVNQTPIGIELSGSSNIWLSQVTGAAVGGIPLTAGVVFDNDRVTKHAYSDGTNRLAGIQGGALESWTVQ
jgi:hypothetical protein